jgi:hypothetical protein
MLEPANTLTRWARFVAGPWFDLEPNIWRFAFGMIVAYPIGLVIESQPPVKGSGLGMIVVLASAVPCVIAQFRDGKERWNAMAVAFVIQYFGLALMAGAALHSLLIQA